jgi:hypothetical protein
MSDANKLEPGQVRIVSIAHPETAEFGHPKDWANVVFKIRKDGPEFSVLVDRRNVADENLTRVARHYLHMQMREVVQATESWRLSDAEYQEAVPPPKTRPIRGLGNIPT